MVKNKKWYKKFRVYDSIYVSEIADCPKQTM